MTNFAANITSYKKLVRLLLFTKQLEGVAQAEERTRISRQLHDDIGHRLIRTKMMSEAALLTLP